MIRRLTVLAFSLSTASMAATPPPARPTQPAQPPPSQPTSSDQPPPPPTAPPPAVDDSAPVPTDETEVERPREVKLARFGAGVNGGAVPAYYGIAWGVGVELGVSLNFGQRFSLKLLANYTHTENGPYSTNAALALIEPTFWFGVYGIGAAGYFGVADISREGLGAALGAFASPAKVRFGQSITHELSLDIGVILITSDSTGASPFGRLAYNIYF